MPNSRNSATDSMATWKQCGSAFTTEFTTRRSPASRLTTRSGRSARANRMTLMTFTSCSAMMMARMLKNTMVPSRMFHPSRR